MAPATIETYTSLDALRDGHLRQLADYWTALRGGRVAPAKSEIDPADIAPLLPYVFFAEAIGLPPDFRFRLAGSHLRDVTGNELTGKLLDEVFPPDFADEVRVRWRQAIAEVRPLVGRSKLWIKDRQHVNWESVVLPVTRHGSAIDLLLGGFAGR